MWKALKNYWAFTNPVYRLIMWLLVPGVFLGVNAFAGTLEIIEEVDILWMGSLILLYIFDAAADYWFMGGFYVKNNSSLEFMQSSNRFSGFMRSVVLVDMVRRVLLYIVLSVTAMWMGLERGYAKDWYMMFSYLPLLEVLIAQITALVGRRFVIWNYTYLCVLIGFFGILLSMISIAMVCMHYPALVNGILMILVFVVDAVTVWYTGKKVRDSFYD